MRWLLVVLVLIGDVLVVEKIRLGFYLWVIVDGFFSISNYLEEDYVEAVIFGLYALVGVYGLYSWRRGN